MFFISSTTADTIKFNYFNALKNYPTLTAQTGSRVSPTKKVTSHNSGIDAKNFKSSANPVLFSNIVKSGSSAANGPSLVKTSGIMLCNLSITLECILHKEKSEKYSFKKYTENKTFMQLKSFD